MLNDCSLPDESQRRNIFSFALFWCIYYLSAPVSYVGPVHANLLKALGNSDTINNFPSAIYMWMSVVPVIIAWIFPRPRHLKPLALAAVTMKSLVTAAVALVLWRPFGPQVITGCVIVHAAVFGAANGIMITAIWDFLRRSVASGRRGRALGFAFGIGPLFACLGALLQDASFDGRILGGFSFGWEFPSNYLALFAGTSVLMIASGIPVAMFIVPLDEPCATTDATTFGEIRSGLAQFLRNKYVLRAVAIYVLVYSGGNEILANLSLHAADVIPEETNTLGLQAFLRFGFKAIAGALLGWLLARSNPRATLFATTSVLLAGLAWALNTTGWTFMLTFGLLGAGELFGAYFPNYIASASHKQFVRINMAYLTILSVLIGFSSLLFGFVADRWGREPSFFLAAGMLVAAIALIARCLPADPAKTLAES